MTSRPKQTDLHDDQQYYRLMADHCRDIIFFVDSRNGQILEINEAAIEAYGYTRDELLQMTIYDIRANKDRQIIAQQMECARRTGCLYETVHCRKDGRQFDVEVSSRGIHTYKLISVVRDITARKRAEQALRESEEQYRLLFAANPNPMWVFDEETLRFLAVNDAATQFYGWSREEFLGMSILDVRLPDERQSAEFIIHKQNGVKETCVGIFPHQRKNAPVADMEVTVSSIIFDGRRGRLCAMKDITERRRTEEALRISEEKFAKAFAINPAAISLTRLEDGCVLEVNQSWENLFGFSREEIIGRSTRELGVWPDKASINRFVNTLRESSSLHAWEQKFKSATGHDFVAELSAQILTINKEPVVLSTMIDITARQLASEALRRMNADLEQRVQERTAHAQSLAEQLRALAVELSHAEQCERKRLASVLHDHIQQLLVAARMQIEWMKQSHEMDRIHTGAQAVESILREAIAAARSLTVDLSPPILHEAGLAGGLNWLVGRMKESHQFRVKLRTDPRAQPADEETSVLLFECVREVLLNVLKHAGTNEAEVTLLRTGNNCIRLIVKDEGDGFDTTLLENRKPEETTFGLFSIQQRLAHLGGQVEIVSSPGKGTTVTLTVPNKIKSRHRHKDLARKDAASCPVVRTRRKSDLCRILVVDDHRIMREGLRGLLQFEPGFEIVGEAADGPQAIELAGQLEPDVVIMDVNLGVMSGIEATRQIVAQNPHVKVIGLSMHVDPEIGDAMRTAGAVAYLMKGGRSEDLIQTIRGCTAAQPMLAIHAGSVMPVMYSD